MKIGYYIFFGNGDYHAPEHLAKNWTYAWDLSDWKNFISDLKALDVNTLMIYLNGHFLPYASSRYPELIDRDHPNIKNEFLSILLKYIKDQGISVIAVVTTTGHAGQFSTLNPDAAIKTIENKNLTEEALLAFPEHLRKDKSIKKKGVAQVGYGVLCHNYEKSRQYAFNIIQEIIEMYGCDLDGIALHPPESIYPCQCQLCSNIFERETTLNLNEVSSIRSREFFILSYLKFQKNILFEQLVTLGFADKCYIFTVPWLFEQSFEQVISYIPNHVSIIDWDYNLDEQRILTLQSRLAKYSSKAHKIVFMPTAGFSFDPSLHIGDQISAVQLQMTLAEEIGVDGIIHFLGPKTSEYMLETSPFEMNNNKASSLGY